MKLGLVFSWMFTICLSASALLGADTTVYSVDQLRNTINAANPGDRIYIAPGYYPQRLWASAQGTAENPIEILALDPNNRPVFDTQESGVFTLYNSSHVIVDGVIAQGAGSATSAGNNLEFTNSHHMVLKNSVSRDVTHAGNSDGFKFAGTSDFLVYNCESVTWGDGGSGFDMYNTHAGLVMRSYFSHPLPPGNSANSTQPKGGAYNNGYFRNYFSDGGSRQMQFGGSQSGNLWEDQDSVSMGNVIEDGEASIAYVSSTNCIVRHNTIVDPDTWVMRILKEGGAYPTAENEFSRNLVVYDNNIMSIQNIGSNTDPASFTYEENYWYNMDNPAGSIPTLPGGETNPAGGMNPVLDAKFRPLYAGARDYGAHAPGVEDEFASYQSWFQWAWDQALVYEPDADAGDGYAVGPGGSLILDAGNSYAGTGSYGDHSIIEYLWDLDGDNVFDDASGETVELDYLDVLALAGGSSSLDIQLQIASENEYNVLYDWDLTSLSILQPNPGDTDMDGDVDAVDLATLGVNWDPAGTDLLWSQGDFNGDGDVDAVDLAQLGTNWNPAGTIPEPGCLAILAGGVVAIARRKQTVV